jgi:hypothetical protein
MLMPHTEGTAESAEAAEKKMDGNRAEMHFLYLGSAFSALSAVLLF